MSRHQRQCLFLVDAASGTQTGHVPGPGHSWEHRIAFDGDRFVALLHGDAGLRGIGVIQYGLDNSYLDRVAFAVKGGDPTTGGAYQNTFTRAGNLVRGDDGFALLFATENDPTYAGASAVLAPRNLVLAHVVADFDAVDVGTDYYDVRVVDTATQNPAAVDLDVQIVDYWGNSFDAHDHGLVWLTDHADLQAANVESPKLVRLDDGSFVALWEQWSLSSFVGLWGMVVDEWGHTITAAQSLGVARLYRGDDAISLGDRAAWVVGDASVPQLVLYTVDASLDLARFDLP